MPLYFENEFGQLYQGECLEIMKTIPDNSIDMILTDPPFGVTACKWDTCIPFEPMWEQIHRIVKPNSPILLFGTEPFSSNLRLSNLKHYRYDWIWHKSPTLFQHAKNRPMPTYENISVFCINGWGHKSQMKDNRMNYYPQGITSRDPIKVTPNMAPTYTGPRNNQIGKTYTPETGFPSNILKFAQDKQKVHPTQKPIKLIEYLIKTYTKENELVIDFTIGSGTTAVGCCNTNRKYIGIDISSEYLEIAKQRIESSTNLNAVQTNIMDKIF